MDQNKTIPGKHFIFLQKRSKMCFNNFVLTATVLECNNQTLTVKGLPFWFTYTPHTWKLAGTDIHIIDYIGTSEIGMLYLSKEVLIEPGKEINITYINI